MALLPIEIDYLCEGRSDEPACRKLITAAGAVPGASFMRPLRGTGKHNVDSRIPGLNAGAKHGNPVLVLRDLDKDAVCAPELVKILVTERDPNLLLRICVHEMESWLLADREGYADHAGIRISLLPSDPEEIKDPKQLILNLADSGRARKLATFIKAKRRLGVQDWAILGEWHGEFAEDKWNIAAAMSSGKVPSLNRAIQAIRKRTEEIRFKKK